MAEPQRLDALKLSEANIFFWGKLEVQLEFEDNIYIYSICEHKIYTDYTIYMILYIYIMIVHYIHSLKHDIYIRIHICIYITFTHRW